MNEKPLIIDVREPNEFATSHVAGAVNIPLGDIAKGSSKLSKISKASNLVVYCRSGGRSAQAKSMLERVGYTSVQNGINQSAVEAKFT